MMKTRYSGWQTFRMKGRQFLALIALDGSTAHIYGSEFANYGAWFSVTSFKKHYAKDGETLNLDALDAAAPSESPASASRAGGPS